MYSLRVIIFISSMMDNFPMIIRRAFGPDAEWIESLRLASYANAKEFVVRNASPMRWGAADTEHITLAAFDTRGLPVSTVRGALLFTDAETETALECTVPSNLGITFPTLLLGKGATASSQARTGLHNRIRLCFLELALAIGIKSVIGLVFESAPRTRSMRIMGYKFSPCQEWWFTDLIPATQTLIAVLHQERLVGAVDYLRSTEAVSIAQYPWTDFDDVVAAARARMAALGAM
jgi:hypothetical protein